MKFTILLAAVLMSYAAHAVSKTPKTIIFKQQGDEPEIIVKFDKELPLKDPQLSSFPIHRKACETRYYNIIDKVERVNGHRFMYNDDVKVYVGDEQFWVTNAYSIGLQDAFGDVTHFCTTSVYENTEDCLVGKNAVRISIGVYKREFPVYTNAADYRIGWERDTDKAFLSKGFYKTVYRVGVVTAWH